MARRKYTVAHLLSLLFWCFLELDRGNDFGELAHDLEFVGGLDAGVLFGMGAGDDLEEKFVAGGVGEAGVVAVEVDRAKGHGACLDPG